MWFAAAILCPPTNYPPKLLESQAPISLSSDFEWYSSVELRAVIVLEEQSKRAAEFYDLRGARALSLSDGLFGSSQFSVHLKAPYEYAESVIYRAYQDGARRLLDLCCGTGTHSVAAAKIGFEVVGFDISAQSVAAAIQLAERCGVQNKCTFEVCSFEEFQRRPTQKYDVIFISGSLYYLNLDRVIGFVSNGLNSPGVFVCVETYGGNPFMAAIRRLKNSLLGHRDQRTLNHLLSAREIKRLSKAFEIVRVCYFDFITLGCSVLGRFGGPTKALVKLARKIDAVLLNTFGLRLLSFKFVVVALRSEPVADNHPKATASP